MAVPKGSKTFAGGLMAVPKGLKTFGSELRAGER